MAASSSPTLLPGLTFLVPNWNHEFVLPRALSSCLKAAEVLGNQSIQSEIIVIDDASRDGSRVLLLQLEALYTEAGLKVIRLESNRGLSYVRNLGLELATFRHILFLDADNEVVPEAVSSLYRSILETKAACVYGNVPVERSGQIETFVSNESVQAKLFVENYIDALALYDRLQLLELGGFRSDSEMFAHEDWELHLHLVASGRDVIFVPIIAGIYHALKASYLSLSATDEHVQRRTNRALRIFNQLGIREVAPLRSKHKRYHPEIGFF